MDLIPQLVTEGSMAESNAKELLTAYGVPFTQAGELIELGSKLKVIDENDHEGMKIARETRLELRKHRITIEKRHDELKADSLATGRAIDLVQRVALAEIKPVEEHLQLQEDFAKVQQELRHTKLVEDRRLKLSEWVEDTSVYNFGDIAGEAFEALLQSLKTAREAQIKAEEVEEANRVALELKEAKEKKARDEADKTARIKAEKEADKQRAIAIKAKEEAAKAVKEAESIRLVQAQKEADEKAETDRIAEEAKKAEFAPDFEKLLRWVDTLESVRMLSVNLSTNQASKLYGNLIAHLDVVIKVYRDKVKELL